MPGVQCVICALGTRHWALGTYNQLRDGPDTDSSDERPAARVQPERPADLHGQAGGVGPSSEADAAAAGADSREAGGGQDRAAEAGGSGADAGAATWTLTVTADTTNGGIKVEFTAENSKTIRVACILETCEATS